MDKSVLYRIIDKKTGKEADLGKIAREDWAKELCGQADRFACAKDGSFLLCDANGHYVDVPPWRFTAARGVKCPDGSILYEGDKIAPLTVSDGITGTVCYGTYKSPFDGAEGTAHIGFYVEWEGPGSDLLRKDLGYWMPFPREIVSTSTDA